LVTRHGNYCIIDGNYFIGDESNNVGGVRLINTGHWVTNNYFYNLRGTQFKSPLAVMNGIPKSPLNRYNQVTDVVIAHNTWVNCVNPWHFGVGSNVSQKDVLPLSEIRSARPIRTTVANNLIYNDKADKADKTPIVAHDKVDGINFQNNLISNQGADFEKQEGLEAASIEVTEVAQYIFAPKSGLEGKEVFVGFDFETIEKDIFGNTRSNKNAIGAMTQNPTSAPNLLEYSKYGPSWFSNEKADTPPTTLTASAAANDLAAKIAEAKDGDIVALGAGDYAIAEPLVINKKITLQSASAGEKARIVYTGAENTPIFEM
ncbi:MAG: chondroitinase-B domain-containing protein, partial [Chitinophagales bacterium]